MPLSGSWFSAPRPSSIGLARSAANIPPELVGRQQLSLTEADRYSVKTPVFDKTGAVVLQENTKRKAALDVNLPAGTTVAFIVYAENHEAVMIHS